MGLSLLPTNCRVRTSFDDTVLIFRFLLFCGLGTLSCIGAPFTPIKRNALCIFSGSRIVTGGRSDRSSLQDTCKLNQNCLVHTTAHCLHPSALLPHGTRVGGPRNRALHPQLPSVVKRSRMLMDRVTENRS